MRTRSLLLGMTCCLAAPARAGQETSPSMGVHELDPGYQDAADAASPETRDDDRPQGPYFFVAGRDSTTDRLPLKSTRAEVHISGVIAEVSVHQVFENSGKSPIEAVYVFPASTRAAVHGMRMRIGHRTIEARIARRQEARQEYEAAREAGQRASLLEQERSNVFTTSVANVMPGDRIEVELRYSEMIVPEGAVYELVFPASVGPRYTGGADPEREAWMTTPYLPAGRPETYEFGVHARVEAGVGIKEIVSPSHEISLAWSGPKRADVNLARPGGGNRDFVLRYRLSGDSIESGIMLGHGAGERYFALLVEPPRRPTESTIVPREYIFLLDVSGSMRGFPLDTARVLMSDLLGHLRPIDRFNVVLFAGGSRVWDPAGSQAATPANIARALTLIDGEKGGGGTELMTGLQAAYRIPRAGDGTSRTVVVVTDGYVGVESKVFGFIRRHLNRTNLFAFGIGSQVNRELIEAMARAGMGEPFVVLDAAHAPAGARRLRQMIEAPVLTEIGVRFEGVDAHDVLPQYVPDLLAERPLVVLGKYRPGSGPARVEVTGRSGAARFSQVVSIPQVEAGGPTSHPALRALWARKRVEQLGDTWATSETGRDRLEAEITRLGLGHDLLTAFTSFVAVDSEAVNRSGGAEKVRQPLPLPAGVPNTAVGYGIGGLGGRYAREPSVVPGAAHVSGTLDKEIIRRVIRRHMNEVRNCYELELQKTHTLAGRVVLKLSIGADGKVQAVEVADSTLGNATVEACMVKAALLWEFPKPVGGGVVVIHYPFVLTPHELASSPPPGPSRCYASPRCPPSCRVVSSAGRDSVSRSSGSEISPTPGCPSRPASPRR